ncbi:MAG: hypothetical protein KC503_37335 [Myxococcales bacterium]|nr:hypothetical protein [Myxococcales bacterium]
MPEGDSIHKIAALLAPRITGGRLRSMSLRSRGELTALRQARVEGVEALGKHLLIALADNAGERWIARTHLGMKGRWHVYRRGEPLELAPSRAVLRFEIDDDVFVCFDAPQAEVIRRSALAIHPQLSRLGPDLLAPELDEPQLLRRVRAPAHAAREIGDVLLDQTVAAGIGNVYKSEVCFLEQVLPFDPTAALADETLLALYRQARTWLSRNLGPWPRTTTFDRSASEQAAPRDRPLLWVYGRSKMPCLRCNTAIKHRRQGDLARPTYWCPHCQTTRATM